MHPFEVVGVHLRSGSLVLRAMEGTGGGLKEFVKSFVLMFDARRFS